MRSDSASCLFVLLAYVHVFQKYSPFVASWWKLTNLKLRRHLCGRERLHSKIHYGDIFAAVSKSAILHGPE